MDNKQDDWKKLAAAVYQAAGAYDMPERVLDALSAAANGLEFAHLVDGILPVNPPLSADQDDHICRQAYDDFYHKVRAEVGYDHWRAIWRFIAKRLSAPVAAQAQQPVSGADWLAAQWRDNLHAFLNAAAGEGFVLDGVDAADLYSAIFPDRFAEADLSGVSDRPQLYGNPVQLDHLPDTTKMVESERGAIESALAELVDKIMPGLDTGDLLADAATASKALDAQPSGNSGELPPLPKPDSYLFQHEETGLTECVDGQQVGWGFEKNNPRHHKIGGMFTEGQMQDYARAAIDAARKEKENGQAND